jgi:hypothetical protein
MPRARPRAYGMGGAISREVERLLGWWGLGLRAVDWRVPERFWEGSEDRHGSRL